MNVPTYNGYKTDSYGFYISDDIMTEERSPHYSGPFYKHGLTLIPAWISNHIHYKVWDEITYPFLNFNGATVEVWEWINNFIPYIIVDVITYPCRD